MTEHSSGIEEWKKHTTAFDRIVSIATTVSHPRPVPFIADRAHIAENTARVHLERLANLNVLIKTQRDDGALYFPDPLHTRMQAVRDLLDEHDHGGLIELKADLQSQIESWEADHNVKSPEELRSKAEETGTDVNTVEVQKTANEWELVEHRLSILEEAIENYETYT